MLSQRKDVLAKCSEQRMQARRYGSLAQAHNISARDVDDLMDDPDVAAAIEKAAAKKRGGEVTASGSD